MDYSNNSLWNFRTEVDALFVEGERYLVHRSTGIRIRADFKVWERHKREQYQELFTLVQISRMLESPPDHDAYDDYMEDLYGY